jgi:hypothetical protein
VGRVGVGGIALVGQKVVRSFSVKKVRGSRRRQDEAMIEQFSAAEPLEETEQRGWQQIRRAAVSRKLKVPSPLAEG